MPSSKTPMLQYLIQKKHYSQEKIDQALKAQKENSAKDLGQILIDLGMASEWDILQAKAHEKGVHVVDLERFAIDPQVIALIPERLAKTHQVLPLKKEGSSLWLAMNNVNQIQAVDEARMASGFRIVPVMASPALIESSIQRFYGQQRSSAGNQESSRKGSDIPSKKAMPEAFSDADGVEQAPVIRLANSIIQQAIADRASDIHVEPQNESVRVRYRIDGVLIEALNVPKNLQAPLISRIKLMAEMDIAERRLPQDGRILMRYSGKEYDLRASCIPAAYGEKIALRVLDKSRVMIGLESLGFTKENREKIDSLSSQPNGMFLCTGPTGSGKTTTQYAVLQMLNKPGVNILTVEDPVEYQIAGISQVQVNRKAGLSFASALRAFLRQDPDIIMVGEMRDLETSQIAVESALTGHLVLSTLHTNDAPSAALRLIDMGIEPYLISATIIGVLAQRLGRRLCPHCKKLHQIKATELVKLGYLPKSPDEEVSIYKAAGCDQCRHTGYKGQMGIHELMILNDEIAELIVQRASIAEIRTLAKSLGMKELKEDGLAKVLEGVTDPDEVTRVVFTAGSA